MLVSKINLDWFIFFRQNCTLVLFKVRVHLGFAGYVQETYLKVGYLFCYFFSLNSHFSANNLHYYVYDRTFKSKLLNNKSGTTACALFQADQRLIFMM